MFSATNGLSHVDAATLRRLGFPRATSTEGLNRQLEPPLDGLQERPERRPPSACGEQPSSASSHDRQAVTAGSAAAHQTRDPLRNRASADVRFVRCRDL